jgi:hypothetical protein
VVSHCQADQRAYRDQQLQRIAEGRHAKTLARKAVNPDVVVKDVTVILDELKARPSSKCTRFFTTLGCSLPVCYLPTVMASIGTGIWRRVARRQLERSAVSCRVSVLKRLVGLCTSATTSLSLPRSVIVQQKFVRFFRCWRRPLDGGTALELASLLMKE